MGPNPVVLRSLSEREMKEFPLWLQWYRNPTGIHEDVCSICGLTKWVKDPALLWLWSAAAALILTPSLGTYICGRCGPKKKKKKGKLTCRHMHPYRGKSI